MKSRPRRLVLVIGCQISTGKMRRPRNERYVNKIVEHVRHVGRHAVGRARVRELRLVPGPQHDLHLLLEQITVGGVVQQRAAQGLHLAGHVAAPDAEAQPSAGEHVHRRVVLGQPQRMPGGDRVEERAELEPPGVVGQVQAQQRHVADAAVALALKVVLGQPEGVVARPLHQLGEAQGLVVDRRQVRVALPPPVRRRPPKPGIRHLHVAAVEGVDGQRHAGRLCIRQHIPLRVLGASRP